MSYLTQYPPAHNNTYVKATNYIASSPTFAYPYYATDPAKSKTGSYNLNAWMTDSPVITNQRFHIDLGAEYIIERIYYENFHSLGIVTNRGCKNFTFWGSNNAGAFAELTYSIDTNWTQLTTNVSQFEQHIAADQADPKYVLITNSTAYRYYAIKIADGWGTVDQIGVRRFELQTEVPVTFIPRIIYF